MPGMQENLTRIADRARVLLSQTDESARYEAMRQAELKFLAAGLLPARVDRSDPNQFMADLIEHNMLLPDWMRANDLTGDALMVPETFEELIDRLTPLHRT